MRQAHFTFPIHSSARAARLGEWILAVLLILTGTQLSAAAPTASDLPVVPGIGDVLHPQLPLQIVPATSFDIPIAYGGASGQVAAGLDLETSTSIAHKVDGTAAVGFGLGNPSRLGFDVGVNIFDLDPRGFGHRGSLDLKFHHQSPNGSAVAVGVQNGFIWGSSDDPTRLYAVAARRYNLKSDPDASFSRVYLTGGLEYLFAGSQNGRYEAEARRLIDQTGPFNVVGSAAIRVTPSFNAFAEWNGEFPDLGISVAPFRNFPLVITPALLDLTGRSGAPARFNVGFSGPFSLLEGLRGLARRRHRAVYNVDVRMVDAADGTPISGGRVRVISSTGIRRASNTDRTGSAHERLVLPIAEPNAFRVMGTARGFQPAIISAVLISGAANHLTLRLQTELGSITGRLSDSVTRFPVSDAEVILAPAANAGVPIVTTSGVDGVYRFDRQPAGRYSLKVHKPGYADVTRPVEISNQNTTVVNFELSAERGGIAGHVVDGAGKPISGAAVSITDAAGVRVARRTTSQDGGFAAQMTAGEYTLQAEAAGYQATVIRVNVLPGQLKPVIITLQRS